MFFLYLRRELGKRKRQTAVVASGLAIAIGLAVVVQSASTGVGNAQAAVLQSMYGIGTDVAVTRTSTAEFGPQRFEIGGDAGRSGGDTRVFSRSRLRAAPGTDTMTAAEITSIGAIEGVAATTGLLTLTSTTFNGELPTFMTQGGGQQGGATGTLSPMPQESQTTDDQPAAPQGGFDGRGGSAFDISSFTVQGFDPTATGIGAMTTNALTDGRLLIAADVDAAVALVDATYAGSSDIATGSTLLVGGESLTVVGLVQSTATDGSAAADVYIPLTTAQRLSGLAGVTSIAVSVDSAANVAGVAEAIAAAVPDATVNSAATLADSVSGTLGTAASLVGNLGKWLSLLMLLAAFLLAMLLTASGVQRRTREFGTLKAMGWRSGRIVRQVVGESLVTGALGGVAGLFLGGVGVALVNAYAPALTAVSGGLPFAPAGSGMGPGGGLGGPGRDFASTTTTVALDAVISPGTVALALSLALVGGILAGAFGGWRASRLRPAAALRSVA